MRILKALSMFATAAITAGGLAAGAANPVSASTAGGCTSYYVIGVRGSTQDYTNFENMGPTVGVYAQNASNLLPSGTTTFQNIIYPATLTNYWGSLGNGIVALADQVHSDVSVCPGARIGLIGYSQGAQVVHIVLNDGWLSDSIRYGNIAAVLLLSDPESAPHADYVFSPTTGGTPGTHDGGGFFGSETLLKPISNVTTEICIQGDPICDAPNTSLLLSMLNLAANSSAHFLYNQTLGSLDIPDIYATEFVARLILPPFVLLSGGGGSPPPPPVLTSLAGLADGTVVNTVDTGTSWWVVRRSG